MIEAEPPHAPTNRDAESADGGKVHLWVNPPDTRLPLLQGPVRFAVGMPTGPSTNSWKVWVRGDDIYVACRDNFREIKVSLHASGIWRVGFTDDFARQRPDMLPPGGDRVWKKWTPRLDDQHRVVIGFQLAAPAAALYLEPKDRRQWPSSVVFVEPPSAPHLMTVISVAVVLGRSPVRVTPGNGVPIAVVPLGQARSVQLVATYENARAAVSMIKDAFPRALATMGGLDSLPENGVFLVLGNRGEDIPWISAVPFQKTKSRRRAGSGAR